MTLVEAVTVTYAVMGQELNDVALKAIVSDLLSRPKLVVHKSPS